MSVHKQNKIYIQISAGRGPAECCWVVAQVLSAILEECKGFELNPNIIDCQKGPENGTLYSALLEVSGVNVENKLNSWQGVIQWIGKSPYRKFHKRKNWFIGIAFFNAKEQCKPNLSELEFQTFRASGPGGQHRNKVETAVRVTHKPTGLTVTATESRSQHQNKQMAIKKLEEAFRQELLSQQKRLTEEKWQQHLSLERGNAVKVFDGQDFVARR